LAEARSTLLQRLLNERPLDSAGSEAGNGEVEVWGGEEALIYLRQKMPTDPWCHLNIPFLLLLSVMRCRTTPTRVLTEKIVLSTPVPLNINHRAFSRRISYD
jgi:hypothetical protein